MRIRNSIRLLILLSAFLFPRSLFFVSAGAADLSASAADSDAAFIKQSWKAEHGLPSDAVESILQTRDGYLWIGTRAGLARFDGVQFVNFTRSNTPEMRSEFCARLAEDREGRLWIGTHNGLLRYEAGVFTLFDANGGLMDRLITVLCPSFSGGLWIGTQEAGVYYLEDGKFTHYTVEHGLPSNRIRSLFEEPNGRLWCGTHGKTIAVARREPLAQGFETLASLDTPSGLDAIHVDPDGAYWLHFDDTLHRFQSGRVTFSVSQHRSEYGVISITRNRAGNFWLCAGHQEIDFLSVGQLIRYSLGLAPTNGSARALHEDREGNLWIGSDSAGLHRWTPRHFQTYTATNGLTRDQVWTVYETRDGAFWFGTEAGFSQLKDGQWKSYVYPDPTRPTIRSFAEDAQGALWVGTIGRGADRLHHGQITNFPLPGGDPGNKVRVLLMARDGTLWIGSEGGLFAMREGKLQAHFTTAQGLPHNLVGALHEGTDGRLWIGTAAGGLMRMERGAFEAFTPSNGPFTNLVRVIHEDAEGTLWIGSKGGLHRLHGDRLETFTVEQGLQEDHVNLLLEDDQGRFWIGSNQALYRVRKRDLQAVAEGKATSVRSMPCDHADGLLSTAMSGYHSEPAAWKGRDGRLWFATSRGVAVVDPKNIIDNDTPPSVYIEQVLADKEILFDNSRRAAFQAAAATPLQLASNPSLTAGRPAPAAAKMVARRGKPIPSDSPHGTAKASFTNPGADFVAAASLIPVGGSPTGAGESPAPPHFRPGSKRPSSIDLPPGRGKLLEFHYTAPQFAAPHRVRFKYRLEGLEENWTDAGTRRIAYYTAPLPGRYTFRVRACNEHGLWNEAGAAFAFYLAPHLWQTWWFHPAWISSVTLFGVALHRRRVRLIAERKELENHARLAEQRALLGADLHDSAGFGLCEIIQQCKKAEEASGDARFGEIAASAREVLDGFDQTVWLLKPGNDTLDRLAVRFIRILEKPLETAGLKAQWSVPDDLPAVSLKPEAQRDLLLVLRESLHNVLNHAHATHVRFELALAGDELIMALTDDGRGFDPAAIPADHPHGLNNLRRRANKWQGRVEVVSRPGAGTLIRLSVPLKTLSAEP